MGIYDGSTTKALASGTSSGNMGFSSASYGNAGTTSSSIETGHTKLQIGVSTSSSTSGLIAKSNSISKTISRYKFSIKY